MKRITARSFDFAIRRKGLNPGQARQELRPWIGRPASALPAAFPALPASQLASPRFAGRVRIDGYRNAVFPHFDLEGLCGYASVVTSNPAKRGHRKTGQWIAIRRVAIRLLKQLA